MDNTKNNTAYEIDLKLNNGYEDDVSKFEISNDKNKAILFKSDAAKDLFFDLKQFSVEYEHIKEEETGYLSDVIKQENINGGYKFVSESFIGFSSTSGESSDNESNSEVLSGEDIQIGKANNRKSEADKCSEVLNCIIEKWPGDSCDNVTYNCDKCGITYSKKKHLHQHVKLCSRQCCSICKKMYLSKSRLKKHFLTVHVDSKPYSCEYCHRTYLYKSMLEQHLRIHLRLKPFSCEKCDRSFTTKSDLKKHIARHANPRFKTKIRETDLTKLDVCPLCFKHVVNLHVHMYSHTNNSDSISCNLCSVTLKSLRALYAHVRLHSGKKFECDVCHKEFNRKSNMLAHRLIHSKTLEKSKMS